ncbi:unnamed protein product, partial [Amoebophrya sp. A25]
GDTVASPARKRRKKIDKDASDQHETSLQSSSSCGMTDFSQGIDVPRCAEILAKLYEHLGADGTVAVPVASTQRGAKNADIPKVFIKFATAERNFYDALLARADLFADQQWLLQCFPKIAEYASEFLARVTQKLDFWIDQERQRVWKSAQREVAIFLESAKSRVKWCT